MITQSLSGVWQMREVQNSKWLPVTVSGGTYTDLPAAGQIPDPFVGENEKVVQGVADRDWEYYYEFLVVPELLREDKVELICTGLDTLAEITLNGQLLGQTNAMFRTSRWEVFTRREYPRSIRPDGRYDHHCNFPCLIDLGQFLKIPSTIAPAMTTRAGCKSCFVPLATAARSFLY